MSYTPTNWQTGDTVTAEKLNRLENAVFENSDTIEIMSARDVPLIVTLTPTDLDMSGTMDKSPEEIADALIDNKRIFITVPSMGGLTAEMTQFIPIDSGGEEPLYEAWGNFVYLNYNGVDLIITVMLQTYRGDAPTYYYNTSLHPLTPMS